MWLSRLPFPAVVHLSRWGSLRQRLLRTAPSAARCSMASRTVMSTHLNGLALAFATFSLSACAALFGTSLTPQEQACMRRSMENVPDLTGTWETNTGKRLALQPDPGRKTTVRAQLTADSKAPNPRWVIEAVYLQWPRNATPQSEECGANWTVSVRQTFPDRKPGGPGQFVSLTDNRTATLSTSFDSISFGGVERRCGNAWAYRSASSRCPRRATSPRGCRWKGRRSRVSRARARSTVSSSAGTIDAAPPWSFGETSARPCRSSVVSPPPVAPRHGSTRASIPDRPLPYRAQASRWTTSA